MGCVQAKALSSSPLHGLDKLKSDHGYVPSGGTSWNRPQVRDPAAADGESSRPRAVAEERVAERERDSPPPPQLPPIRQIGGGEEEMVDGWPRWLVNNIPREVLTGLMPKSADSYVKIDKVGQGTYSNVYKARDRDTGKVVALKKVRFDTTESESVKFMAREIMILLKLDHPNVLKLEGLATSRMHHSLYLVFDFMQSDLTRFIHEGILTEPQIKCYMQQLLSGLQHCHERGILHRDIKGSNLLIDMQGVLKIGDFGLANYFGRNKKKPLTSRVVTLWYRAPELLLGTTDYGVGIDLWSAGCLLAEMFVGRPIMPGKTEVEQLHKIFKLCGSPPEDYCKRLNLSANFQPPQHYKPSIFEAFRDFPSSSLSLLTTLLELEPSSRRTAASALQSEFFSTHPLACDLSGLPVLPKEEDVTILHLERRKRKSFRWKQQLHEEIEDNRKLDQAMDNESPKEDGKSGLLENNYKHGNSTRSISSGMKPEDKTTLSSSGSSNLQHSSSQFHPLLSLNINNSPPQASNANANNSEQVINAIYSLGRFNSSSGYYRYSWEVMPKFYAALDHTNGNKQRADVMHRYGLDKRSNSTSEFSRFPRERMPNNHTILD